MLNKQPRWGERVGSRELSVEYKGSKTGGKIVFVLFLFLLSRKQKEITVVQFHVVVCFPPPVRGRHRNR